MKRIGLMVVLGCASAAAAAQNVVALRLGPASSAPANAAAWQKALALREFLPVGGTARTGTPTAAFVLWDATALRVRFECSDPQATYANGSRPRRTDQVQVGLAVAGMAQKDLWLVTADRDGGAFVRHAGAKETLAGARLETAADRWSVELAIPWALVGGVPAKPFLMQLARVRGVTGEVLTPVVVDYHDGPFNPDHILAPQHTSMAVSGFVEASLGGKAEVVRAPAGLVTLPSGMKRWVSREVKQPLSAGERMGLVKLQGELATPTTEANLAERVPLAEAWYDLLSQEGFSYLQQKNVDASEGRKEELPWVVREKANEALARGDTAAACAMVHSLLESLDGISKTWFADGTPGDARAAAWTPVVLESADAAADRVRLHARAGQMAMELSLTFPSVGGVRLEGAMPGHFASAAQASPMRAVKHGGGWVFSGNGLEVAVEFGAKSGVSVRRAGEAGVVWQIAPGELRVLLDGGVVKATEIAGRLQPAEQITGLGERFDAVNQRGKTLTLWQEDAWDATVMGGLSNEAYKPVPLWHSSAGYSVFWDTSYELRADFGAAKTEAYRVTAHGPVLDVYVWPGDAQQNLQRYTALTGRAVLPPVWAFEPWMGGGMGRWSKEPGKTGTQAIVDVVTRFHELDIPHSSVYAEGVAATDPKIYEKLKPTGVEILSWGRSQLFGWKMADIEKAMPGVPVEKLPLMRTADGKIYGDLPTNTATSQFPYLDFTDPRALELLTAYWKPSLDRGVAGTMVDFGDLVPRAAVFHDGSRGEQMHNWYATSYQAAEQAMFRKARGDDFILFARGGTAGTQAMAGQMSGDHTSDFRGLEESIVGGLSVSASGFSNWGSDIGGLRGVPDEEVYLRWVEFGAFSPLMRVHGTEPREPWVVSERAVEVYRKYAWVRENLLPYVYGAAQQAASSGVAMMRPLAGNEYMFGDDLLVAPVMSPGERREVVLPAGQWTEFWTGEPVADKASERVAGIDVIPVFVRAGALVPMELPPSFVMGESMTAERVAALMVTAPAAGGVSVWKRKLPSGAAVEVTLHAEAEGFSVTTKQWPELKTMVVVGLSNGVKRVSVDGRVLMAREWKQAGPHRVEIALAPAAEHVVRVAIK